jgi:hypothetical protein
MRLAKNSVKRPLNGRDSLTKRVAFFAFCLVGCSGVQFVESGGSALLAVHGAPGDAHVSVDGIPRGSIARTGGAYLVDAGQRRLQVLAPGYLPYWLDLELVAGEAYDLQTELWPCFDDVDQLCMSAGGGMLDELLVPPAD